MGARWRHHRRALLPNWDTYQNLGIPCRGVPYGWHFSGGGYGLLLRKFGLAADHAQLVDVEGRILNRASMGEDLFWAIRGGGGNTFGKVNLVPVPKNVTVFTVTHTTDRNATNVLEKWQDVADTLPQDLFIRVILDRSADNIGRARFNSLYLGPSDALLPILQRRFLELGAMGEDLIEMSWIQSVLYFAGYPTNSSLEVLQSRIPLDPKRNFKAKSDYVVEPIPEHVVEGIWSRILRPDVEDPEVIFSPYGGRMSEISEGSIPFPHRAGNKFKIQHLIYWAMEGQDAENRHTGWIRELYGYLAPHVSNNPRAAYIKYRDLDIGTNDPEEDNNKQQEDWGVKYFKGNYERLVRVKAAIDPINFFRNEQSISPMATRK